jgi:hypothetical protein
VEEKSAAPGPHDALFGCLSIIAILAVLGGLFWFFVFADSGNSAGGAKGVCEDFVQRRLEFPDEADFSDAEATETGETTWRVTGIVEAETRVVGQAVRHRYTCAVEYKGDDNWELTEGLQLD